jgi:Kyanoviridae head maturation protease
MKLIRELNEEVEYLEEAAGDKKKRYIKGVFLQSNIRNRNGRVYPKGVLMREVARYTSEKIDRNGAYGELGHPDGPVINLSNASHLITELTPDGDNFIGKALLLPTPAGEIVAGIISVGGRIGVSSRAMGSLQPRDDGAMEVQDDLHLSTAADIVADPSAPDAFVRGIMENVEWFYDADNKQWHMEKVETIRKDLREEKVLKMTDAQKLRVFEGFIASLSK